jgi:hypothetical protein
MRAVMNLITAKLPPGSSRRGKPQYDREGAIPKRCGKVDGRRKAPDAPWKARMIPRREGRILLLHVVVGVTLIVARSIVRYLR